jgi:type III pantothenate kinase
VTRIKRELSGQARVLATGGLAEVVAPETELIEVVDPHLTLKGLRIIYDLNRGAR